MDQTTVLSEFEMKDLASLGRCRMMESLSQIVLARSDSSVSSGIKTWKLTIESLSERIQNGFNFTDIEYALFFILFIRFVILAIKYNLKTSFYVTCVGFLAGGFWFIHFTDLISSYEGALVKIPLFQKFTMVLSKNESSEREDNLQRVPVDEMAVWYNPGLIFYYAFLKGIRTLNPANLLPYYIDPISILLSKLPSVIQRNLIPAYYETYNILIPKLLEVIRSVWNQFFGIAVYIYITRLGRSYCPYLIRWHWTFLILLKILESFYVSFVYRIMYYQSYILVPNLKQMIKIGDYGWILRQITFWDTTQNVFVFIHISFVLFALFHAIWGQYFYLPILVPNTELHVGRRPKNSIYSAGQTAWQEPNEKTKNFGKLKLWYGWFGRGTKNKWNWSYRVLRKFKKLLKKI